MKKAMLSQTMIKEQNKKKIIRALWENSPISRVGIAQLTGLNKATITNLMPEIEAEGMVRNVGQQKSPTGRSANLLIMNESYGICASVVIRTKVISIGVGDIFAKTLWEKEIPNPDNADPMERLRDAAAILHEGLEQCASISTRLLGIGIATASLVRHSDDMMYAVHSSSKWYNVPVGEFFRRQFNVPIWVDTAANTALIGEKYFGVAKGVKDALFLSVGFGIGGGMLINGKLFRGANGFAGDVGHFVLDPSGPICRCGKRGCWEVMGSALILPKGETFASATQKAEAGDVESIVLLNEIGTMLGRGIANMAKVINPQLVILGGDVVEAQKWIINPCKTELSTKLWSFVWDSMDVQFSSLGKLPFLTGGFARVIEQLFVGAD